MDHLRQRLSRQVGGALKRHAGLETVEEHRKILVIAPSRNGHRVEARSHFIGVMYRIIDRDFADKDGRDVMDPGNPA